ncbi:MAG: DUF1365 domain-containing protein [Gammaproteobacteria bacterium]
MQSCLYTGYVRHRRMEPTENRFKYRLFMSYLDLAELPELFDRYLLWSARRAAPAWFRRADFHGDASRPLDEAVRELVAGRTGARPTGPIRLLTHLRYFGYSFNPVSFYYCFDGAGERVETIVAEITNTPWKERHAYVLPVSSSAASGAAWRFRFDKQFHVSPFMPMDMRYDWRFGAPGNGLHVHMENWRDGRTAFDATLNLKREEITRASLARALIHFPLVTTQVATLIHWQALKLWAKRTPLFTHPNKLPPPPSSPLSKNV